MSASETHPTTVVEHSQHLAAQGFYPIAIWGVRHGKSGEPVCQCGKEKCLGIGKHPIGNAWQTQSREDALARIQANPGCNIGCLAGSASGLLILDMDVGEGKQGPHSLAVLQAQYGDLPRTPTVETGSGGRHFYFKLPEGLTLGNTSGLLGPGLDTRAENGQGVLPPSVHKSGRAYAWIPDLHPDSTPLAELPPAWLRLLATTQATPRSPVADESLPREASPETVAKLATLGMTRERALELAEAYVEAVPGAVSGERGNSSTNALAHWLIGNCYTYEDAWSLLCEWNDSCDPAWDTTAQYGPDSLPRLFRAALAKECQEVENPWALQRLEDALDRAPILAPAFPENRNIPATVPDEVPSAPKQDARFSAMRGFSVSELQGEPPPVEWLWEGIIPLEPGIVGSLVGAGGLGKTALTVGLAVARALGQPFLGRPTKQGRTVIITKEESRTNYLRKLKAWTMGFTVIQLQAVEENVIILSLQGEHLALVTQDQHGAALPHLVEIAALADAINILKTDLIILETVSRLATAETNEGMAALVEAAESLCKRCGATGMLLHHVTKDEARKARTGDAQSGRGGGALGDNGRFTLVLSKASEKDLKTLGLEEADPDSLLVLAVPKLNAGLPVSPMYLEKVATKHALAVALYDLSADLPATRRHNMAHDLARVVAQHGPMTVYDLEKMVKTHGVPKAQVKAIVGYAKSISLLLSQGRTVRGTEKVAHNPAMPLQPYSQAEVDDMDVDTLLESFPDNTTHTAGSAVISHGGA